MTLQTWVMVGKWDFLDRFEPAEFLDHVQGLGAPAVVLGGTLPIQPVPTHYADSPVKPLPPPAEVMAYRGRVSALLRQAKLRGLEVYLYGTAPHSGRRPDVYRQLPQKWWLDPDLSARPVESYWGACANGSAFLPYYLGRVRDAHAAFPNVDGFLNDGPEFGYEIAPGFMGGNWDLFTCVGPCCAARAADFGFDWTAIRAAAIHLRRWLRHLDERAVDDLVALVGAAGQRDPADALARASGVPAVRDWFRFKAVSIEGYVARLCAGVKAIDPRLTVGIGSRTAAFAPLTGYDLQRLAGHADFLLPKLYLWMGGYDGLCGTVYRWVRTLCEWNSALGQDAALRFVGALFGFTLPGVSGLVDLERHIAADALGTQAATHGGQPFPDAFFSTVVAAEVDSLIEHVGNARRVRPWVGTSHGGRILTPRELDALLTAGEQAGLLTYLYYGDLDGDEWEIARKHARTDGAVAPTAFLH